jgi:hypothetical protein
MLEAPRAVRQQNMVMSPVGLGTKNHCAGEDQQQFSSQIACCEIGNSQRGPKPLNTEAKDPLPGSA